MSATGAPPRRGPHPWRATGPARRGCRAICASDLSPFSLTPTMLACPLSGKIVRRRKLVSFSKFSASHWQECEGKECCTIYIQIAPELVQFCHAAPLKAPRTEQRGHLQVSQTRVKIAAQAAVCGGAAAGAAGKGQHRSRDVGGHQDEGELCRRAVRVRKELRRVPVSFPRIARQLAVLAHCIAGASAADLGVCSQAMCARQVHARKQLSSDQTVVLSAVSVWNFELSYVGLEEVLPMVQQQLAISRLPYAERDTALKVHIARLSVCSWYN